MKEMKTLTFPGAETFEVVDEKARNQIENLIEVEEKPTVQIPTMEDLDKKTEKVQIDYMGGKVFKLGEQTLNYKQLHDIHLVSPDFAFIQYGDRAYLLSYVQDDPAHMREMRFESVIATTDANLSFVKTSGIYVKSSDGVNIAGVDLTDINSENKAYKATVIDDSHKNDVWYPSVKAVVDYVEPVAEIVNQTKEDLSLLVYTETLDRSGLDVIEAYITSDGKWDAVGNGGAYSFTVNLAGVKTLSVISSAYAPSFVCLLKNLNVRQGADADFCTDESRRRIETSDTLTIDVPTDCKVALISKQLTTPYNTPREIKVKRIYSDPRISVLENATAKNEEHIYELVDRMNENDAGIGVLYNASDTTKEDVKFTVSSPLLKTDRKRFVKITNPDSSPAFFTLYIKDNSGNIVFDNRSAAVLISGNSAATIPVIYCEIAEIYVQNINHITFNISVFEYIGRKAIYVGVNREFVKFTDALTYAVWRGNCDIYVAPGEYDLIAEQGEDAIIQTLIAGHYGPKIGYGVNVYLDNDAKLIAHYTGNNELFLTRYAPFNSIQNDNPRANDFKIIGGTIDCSRVRYCVHDECNGKGAYTHEYINCNMILDNSNNPKWNSCACIGGGLGKYGVIIVDGGKYESYASTSDRAEITYHNPQTGFGSDFKNKVIIKNVYFANGGCYVSQLGDSPKYSEFVCTNNSMAIAPRINGQNDGGTGRFRLYAWNNEMRN